MIRAANTNDAPAIAAIQVRAWQVAYEGVFTPQFLASLSVEQRTEFWHRELHGNRSIVLVASIGDSIAGWVSGGASRDPEAQGASEVYAVYVAPELWRHGVGRQLMEAIEERFSDFPQITLWVLEQNRRAIDFYLKLGYQFDGIEKSELLGGTRIKEVRLRKKIGPTKRYSELASLAADLRR